MGAFGQFFKDRRIAAGMTLRRFCLENSLDPGNLSKLERGRLAPPKSATTLDKYAAALGLKKGTSEYQEFLDLAALEAGMIPPDVKDDAELLESLPVFFRTARGRRPSEEEVERLIEIIRRA